MVTYQFTYSYNLKLISMIWYDFSYLCIRRMLLEKINDICIWLLLIDA